LKQIKPAAKILQPHTADIRLPKPKAKSRRGKQSDITAASVAANTHIRPSKQIIYETPKIESVQEDNDDDYEDEFLEEDAKSFGRENVGPVGSPYLMPYVYKRQFLDTQYGIRKEGDIFKIGESSVLVDQDGNITIMTKEFRGSEGLWELLTHERVNKVHAMSDDLRTYKKILLLPNAHLEGYQPRGVINVSRGKNFRVIIAPFSRGPKAEVSNQG